MYMVHCNLHVLEDYPYIKLTQVIPVFLQIHVATLLNDYVFSTYWYPHNIVVT